ncbi:MAG: thiamine phosphate synthase, partial [Singulisphaera sp.]
MPSWHRMSWSFTAAAERALAEAAGWRSCADRDDLDAPELLLGLLAEDECRAAQLLLSHGVDVAQVSHRWPALHRASNRLPRDFSAAVSAAIHAAIERLWAYPRPLSLATEHLLLGLVAAPGETGQWLAEQGVSADELEKQIHVWYGHQPGPLQLESTTEPAAIAETPVEIEPVTATSTEGSAASQEKPRAGEDVAPLEVQESSRYPSEQDSARGETSRSGLRKNLVSSAPAGPFTGGRNPEISLSDAPLLRIIDAAANRAREGLRVVEDYVRTSLDDRFLTSQLKQLRHDLAQALSPFSNAHLLAARDTLGDVGTTLTVASEVNRVHLGSVAVANWKRLQEALRSLEEYTKVTQPGAAAKIEQLRYRSYTLERAALVGRASAARLTGVNLFVLVDGRATPEDFQRMVDELVAAGVGMIQLRDKKLADAELLGRARLLCDRTAGQGTVAIVNDRADIAAAAGADGVHLGQ